jgi:hypothetical protein
MKLNDNEWLKVIRKKMNLSRKNLADILEVTEPVIIRWEGSQKGKDPIMIGTSTKNLIEALEWLFDINHSSDSKQEQRTILSILFDFTDYKIDSTFYNNEYQDFDYGNMDRARRYILVEYSKKYGKRSLLVYASLIKENITEYSVDLTDVITDRNFQSDRKQNKQ